MTDSLQRLAIGAEEGATGPHPNPSHRCAAAGTGFIGSTGNGPGGKAEGRVGPTLSPALVIPVERGGQRRHYAVSQFGCFVCGNAIRRPEGMDTREEQGFVGV